MRLLFITSQFSHGGLETHILTYALELEREGHEVKIMYEEGLSPPEYTRQIERFALPLRAFPKEIKGNMGHLIKIIEWQMKGFRPNVIHLHPFQSLFYGQILAEYFKVPYVLTIHGTASLDYILNHVLGRKLLKDAGHVFVVREDFIPNLINTGVRQDRISFFPNTVCVEEEKRIPSYQLPMQIAVVSRLDLDKYDSLFHFFSLFSQTDYFLKFGRLLSFDVYGSGSEKERLKKDLHLLGMQNVTFKGFIWGNEKYSREYDMVVGMGRVILEAGAQGIPAFIIGKDGVGGFVTKKNYFKHQKTNFALPKFVGILHSKQELDRELIKIKTTEVDIYSFVKKHNNIKITTNDYLDILNKMRNSFIVT